MRNFNKIALACCSVALGMFTMTGCDGGEIFEVNSPDWISDKIQEIEDSKNDNQEEEILEGMQEDVYTFGNTDFSSGWWTAFSKYYVVPEGEKWNAVFNLQINPDASNTYKNFALVLSNDIDRGGEGYKEYGAIRFDNQPSGNSEWGDYIDRSYIQSTLTFETDTDAGIEKLGGKVTLTVDRTSESSFTVKMTNGVVTKTYEQPSKLENLNSDASNTNIRCFLVPEGSYIDFLQTNIVPMEGLTSAADKNPLSMELQNVPTQINMGVSLEEAMAGVTAVVTFEEGVTKTVTADELSFSAIPDMNIPGEKTLVAAYNKTFKGEYCDKPIMANAPFEVIEKIVSIEVTQQPIQTTYYYYTSKATESVTGRTFDFNPSGMEVTATDINGARTIIDNARLSFSTIPASVGTHPVTISVDEDVTATVNIEVKQTGVTEVDYNGTVGSIDNTTGWWGAFSDNFNVQLGETKSIKFTNYTNTVGNWNNFVLVLRKGDESLYYWLRADNYGKDADDVEITFSHAGTQWVNQTWEQWRQDMNGAKVTAYITNCGNGTADVQIEMIGNDGNLDTQYYLGANIDPTDLYFAFTVDGCHLVFGE